MTNLINLKTKYYVPDHLSGYYPPILDYDPTFAAQSLTKEDTEIAYKVLNDCFFNIIENKKYPILYNSIHYSIENFTWFAIFFKNVEKTYTNGEEDLKILYELAPEESKGLLFQEPYRVCSFFNKKKNGYLAEPYKFKLRTNDIINKNRVLYIKKDLELEDFYDGFPGWYIMKNTTVFEKYNERTNVRVRIDYRNGEYYYYVAGASDAWQMVNDVPLEIDDVVSAILFH